MANIVRTRDQLVAEFPDNDLGEIPAQASRDLVVSAFGFASPNDPTADWDNVNSAGVGAYFDTGSRALNTTTQIEWICYRGTAHTAIWQPAYNGGGGGGSTVVVAGEGIRVDGPVSSTYTVSGKQGQGIATVATSFSGGSDCYLQNLSMTGLPTPGTDSFSGSLLYRTLNGGQTAVLACQSDGTGMSWALQQVSGLIQFIVTTAGGGGSPVNVPCVSDGDWHHLFFGYDHVSGFAYLVSDATTVNNVAVSWSTHTSSGLTLGCQYFGGTNSLFWEGDVAQFFFLPKTPVFYDYTLLWNRGCGYLYRQIPCQMAGDVTMFFPLDEDTGLSAVDLVTAQVLAQGASPTTATDGNCGIRLGCAGYIQPHDLAPGTLPPGVDVPPGNVTSPPWYVPGDPIDPGWITTPGTLPPTVIVPIGNISPPPPTSLTFEVLGPFDFDWTVMVADPVANQWIALIYTLQSTDVLYGVIGQEVVEWQQSGPFQIDSRADLYVNGTRSTTLLAIAEGLPGGTEAQPTTPDPSLLNFTVVNRNGNTSEIYGVAHTSTVNTLVQGESKVWLVIGHTFGRS